MTVLASCVDLLRSPLLLARKAERLRRETGDQSYRAPFELVQKQTFRARLHATLSKPFVLFIREPALITVTVYLSVSTWVYNFSAYSPKAVRRRLPVHAL